MSVKRINILLTVLSVWIFCCGTGLAQMLTVNSDGVLMQNGKPYRGIGINFFGAFYDAVNENATATYHEDFEYLASHGVPFIRFAATPYWPVHFKLYNEDKGEYFKRMDALVARAEEVNLGLIPSVFWHQTGISDLCGEPRNAWGDPASKTRQFVRRYTNEIVNRYKDSPAIWAWEFGNEFNLSADLPNSSKFRPKINVKLGTPDHRTEADDLTGEDFVPAVAEFARNVRKLDSVRAIISGHSIPREYGWHNWKEKSWTIDTPEQFAEMLDRDNPDPVNTLSVHIYPRIDDRGRYFEAKLDKYQMIAECMKVSRKLKKPLFVGEYGADMEKFGDKQREIIQKLTDTIIAEQVPLSAFWVWSLGWQEPTFNVTATNQRAYTIEIIAEANKKISAQMKD